MGLTMKEALRNAGVELTPEDTVKEEEARGSKHRSKTVVERPKDEVTLKNITMEEFERKKYQNDPTSALVEVPGGLSNADFVLTVTDSGSNLPYAIIWCENTKQTWLATDKLCLDQNFIYRDDLEILILDDIKQATSFYIERGARVNPGIITRKTCYIIDDPADEHYEVYYDTNYPSMKYGKATPNGMFIHKCKDRFHRDMKIMELDKLYQDESAEYASKMTSMSMGANDAIIISDGCFMKNVCSSAYYYLDSETLIKFAQGIVPSEPEQAVLISEVAGATSALEMCRLKGKKCITYYYDNTSILNVFRNRKTEYISEIVKYKNLVEEMDREGYEIKLVELHPKTGDDRDTINKALMYFHNYCDKECTDMARLFSKDYRSIAMCDEPKGKTYTQVKSEFKPKGRPGNGGNRSGVRNNQHNGNNRYGKRF